MQNAEPFSSPVSIHQTQRRPDKKRGWLATIILLALVVILIGAGLTWLQWAGQRGIELGYPKPTVRITSSLPEMLQLNETAHFHAQGTGRNLTYTWNFDDQGTDQSGGGNATTANGQDVSYAYHTNGLHTLTISVRDEIGQVSSAWQLLKILPPPPTAHFTAQVYSFFSSTTVYFDAYGSSSDSSTSIQNYNWDFGDGNITTTSSSQTSHDYMSPGTYTVKLIVEDELHQQSQPFSDTVTISNSNS